MRRNRQNKEGVVGNVARQAVEVPLKQEARRKKHHADMHNDGKDCRGNHPIEVSQAQQLTRCTLGSFRSPAASRSISIGDHELQGETAFRRRPYPVSGNGYLAMATFSELSGPRTTSSDVTAAEESLSWLFNGPTERLHQRDSRSLAAIL